MLETSLYSPVKSFLEGLDFVVKGEIGGCDLLALSGDFPPIVVICELKLRFNLDLVLQGVDRMAVSDEVWLAAPISARGKGRESDRRFRNLCRRLGFGLLGILPGGEVQILLSPTALAPRRDPRRRSRLIEEHRRRQGDPAVGGGSRKPIMTAYRQEALSCAAALADGPETATRPEGAEAERTQNIAQQCVWLVRSARSGRLRPDRYRPRSVEALAAMAMNRQSDNCPVAA